MRSQVVLALATLALGCDQRAARNAAATKYTEVTGCADRDDLTTKLVREMSPSELSGDATYGAEVIANGCRGAEAFSCEHRGKEWDCTPTSRAKPSK